MLVLDIMTRNPITVSSNTPIGEAQRIMREHDFKRLPVVDNGRLVGLVNERRLEQVKPRTSSPLMWQITYIISHTSVGDVMRKKVITAKPTDTVEIALARAQAAKVGALLVIDKNKLVGIATTNDFFYKIVNPTMGLGEPGSRIVVYRGGDGPNAEKIISRINKLSVPITTIWTMPSSSTTAKDIIFHLAIEDPRNVVEELTLAGYSVSVRQR